MLQGISGGLINPQVSGLVQQMFRGEERGRAFGALGTTVGLGTALGPLAGGALIALGGPDLGWRLVFFVNVPVGIAVILLARRFLPQTPATGTHRLDVLGLAHPGRGDLLRAVRRGASSRRSARSVLLLAVPTVVLLFLFWRRERRLTREDWIRWSTCGCSAARPTPRAWCWRCSTSRRWPACRWCWRCTSSVGWVSAPCTPRWG